MHLTYAHNKTTIQVQPGDLFIYLSGLDGSVDFEVAVALAQGAAAIMSGEPFDVVKEEDEEVPVLLVPDSVKAQQIVGAAFYDKPSLRMNVVAVTGTLLSKEGDVLFYTSGHQM